MNYVFFQNNKKTQFRDPVSVEKQVAKTYYLADERRLHKAANAFGISKSTTSKIVCRISKAISVHLAPKYLSLTTCENEIVKLVEKFYETDGFPQCIRAINETHITIKKKKIQILLITLIEKAHTVLMFKQLQITNFVFLTLSSNNQEGYMISVYFQIPF